MALNVMAAGSLEQRNNPRSARQSSTHGSFIPEKLYSLLTASNTVTVALAASPTQSVQGVAEPLFGKHHGHAHHSLHSDEAAEHEHSSDGGAMEKVLGKLHLSHSGNSELAKDKDVNNPAADQWAAMRPLRAEELEQIKSCGKWGTAQPSELFLNVSTQSVIQLKTQMYAQTLVTLEENPLNGMVSPSLMGSCGVVPLSIVSVIPDIIEVSCLRNDCAEFSITRM